MKCYLNIKVFQQHCIDFICINIHWVEMVLITNKKNQILVRYLFLFNWVTFCSSLHLIK